MDWPSLTIAFPTWQRAKYLEKTLASINKQQYPGPLELVIVNSGPDSEMEYLAATYGAKYFEAPRADFPEFQNIAELWNLCLSNATGEIVILQCAEIFYVSDAAIKDLVTKVLSGNKILATALVQDLNEAHEVVNWQNHPTEGSRPGWVSGSGPHAFRRAEMLEHGGYDTQFYGYGHEDDYFFYTLRKNGWQVTYVDTAVCSHQAHPRVTYEPITGHANRALIRILYTETENDFRPPLPNRYPVMIDTSVKEEVIEYWAYAALDRFGMSETFKKWFKAWQSGERHPDDIFVMQRTISNEGLGRPSEVGEMITEAAWAVRRANDARAQADLAYARKELAWSNRCEHCAELQLTWAARALARAAKLMEEK